jgi:hypothetical protein
MNEQKMKLNVVALALRPESANGAQKISAVARELARRSTESESASQVVEGGRKSCAAALKDGRYGSGLNEGRGATEKRCGKSLCVRFAKQRLASSGFGDRFNANRCRMRISNEVALQAA